MRCAIKVFCSQGGGPKVPTDLSGSRTLPRLHPRTPYPIRAPLSTRTAMMINVPSFPNTQGHQGSPVVSLAFVGVPLPADPQAVQERATPLRGVRSVRDDSQSSAVVCSLDSVTVTEFPRPPSGAPQRHHARSTLSSSMLGRLCPCSRSVIVRLRGCECTAALVVHAVCRVSD